MLKYIEDLLQGAEVEWTTLGEVAELKRGKTITKKNSREGIYPVISGGQQPAYYVDQFNREGETITIAGSGAYAGFVMFWNEPIFVSDAFSIQSDLSKALPRYLYYLLLNMQEKIYDLKAGGGVPHVYAKDVARFLIPLPPLSVQAEIVRILDKFTSLEAELEAELDCRKRQYEHYRNQLLSFENTTGGGINNVIWKPLGEICEIVTDFTAAGSFASNARNVQYKREVDYALLVRTTDLKDNFATPSHFVYVDKHAYDYLWRVQLEEETIILPNVGNCGEVYFILPKDIPHSHGVLGPNALFVRSLSCNNKYLYYLFQSQTFQTELFKITSRVGQTKFNKTNLKKILIPLPSLSEQERIVGILDRFEALAHSMSEGLPREIALRRQQYEHYRHELLDFARPQS